MSAERLREAAQVLRERAEAATPGPWIDTPMGSEGSIVRAGGNTIATARKPATCREFADATFIATMHPGLALAVADWLDAVAARAEEVASTLAPNSQAREPIVNSLLAFPHALTVAELVLAGAS